MREGLKVVGVATGAAAVLALGAWAVGGAGGGGVGAYEAVGAEMPGSALAMGAVANPLEIATKLREVMPTEMTDAMLRETGHDLLDAKTWEKIGIDPAAPMGIAWLDVEAEAAMLTFGTVGGADAAMAAMKKAPQVFGKNVGNTELVDIEIAGRRGFYPKNDEILFLFSGERGIGIFADRARRVKGAEDRESGMRILAQRALEGGPETRMNANKGWGDAMSGFGRAPAAGFLNLRAVSAMMRASVEDAANIYGAEELADNPELRRMLDEQMAMQRGIMNSYAGFLEGAPSAGLGVFSDASSASFRYRLTTEPDSMMRRLYQGPSRNTAVYDDIPGPLLGAMHFSVDMPTLRELIASMVASNPWVGRDFERLQDQFGQQLGAGIVDTVVNNLTGEYGLVMDALPSRNAPTSFNVITFVGVKDPKVAESWLGMASAFAGLAGKGADLSVRRETVDGTELYILDLGFVPGMSPAAAVHDGYLWLLLQGSRLRAIVEGDGEGVLSSDRGRKVGAALRKSALGALTVDLQAVFAQIPALLGRRGGREMAEIRPILDGFDYVDGTGTLERGVVVVDETLHFSEGKDLWSVTGAILRKIADEEFRRRDRYEDREMIERAVPIPEME